uniref:Uncharacterized protein n=1 Tax=Salix viminalis TaxID=40686 RepID=A0A6N2N8Q8_SALVM
MDKSREKRKKKRTEEALKDACIGDSVTLDDLQEFALGRIVLLDSSLQVSGVYNKKNCAAGFISTSFRSLQ